jgi:hypothetical protein
MTATVLDSTVTRTVAAAVAKPGAVLVPGRSCRRSGGRSRTSARLTCGWRRTCSLVPEDAHPLQARYHAGGRVSPPAWAPCAWRAPTNRAQQCLRGPIDVRVYRCSRSRTPSPCVVLACAPARFYRPAIWIVRRYVRGAMTNWPQNSQPFQMTPRTSRWG